jgi:hypothetical protein
MTEGQQRAADAWKQVVRKRSIFDTVAGGWRMAATKLCDDLESDESVDFDSLHSFRAAVHNAVSPELRHSLFVLESWRKWTWDAERVFDILDEIDVKA